MAALLFRPLRPVVALKPAGLSAKGSRSTRFQAMAYSSVFNSYLVTPTDLSLALSKNSPSSISTAPRVIALSAAWFLPNDPEKRTGWSSFVSRRIPKSRFFDLDKVKDEASPYPHMLPTPELFAKEMGRLGIRREDTIVVYDTAELGIFSAPRVAWTLKVFGHGDVHVLNNFRKWVEEGLPIEEGPLKTDLEPAEYPVPELKKEMVVDFEEVRAKVLEQGKQGAEKVQILDARPAARWSGKAPEPRPGLSSGHMPHSKSLAHSTLLDPATGAYLPADELRKIFLERGVSGDAPIISSCGTGVTAAVVDAGLAEAGFPQEMRRIYDGSWTEWAQRVKESEGLILKEES